MRDRERRDIESPDGIEPCCVPCSCSFCLPYDDGVLILSQIISGLAFLVSWLWIPTFALSSVGLFLFLMPLCVRCQSPALCIAVPVAMATSLTALFRGLFQMKTDCNYDFTSGRTVCNDFESYGLYACSLFWAIAALLMGVFLTGGRHEKWEEHHRNKNDASDEDENNHRNDRVATRNPSGSNRRNTNRNTSRYPNRNPNRSTERSTDRNAGGTRNRAPTLADLERAVDELERRTDSLSPEMVANELLSLYNLKNDDDH